MLFSQITWAPQSAKWTYNGQGQIISYIEIEYVKDSLLLGKQSKILQKTQYTYRIETDDIVTTSLGNEITYVEDSVVYLYQSGEFDTLYYFNAKINDSWALKCCQGSSNCIVSVKDTGSININGLNLKYIAVEYDYDELYPFKANDTIIERIGTTSMYILPCDFITAQIDGNEGSRLRCYSDNELGSYSNNYEKPCAYLVSINQSQSSNFKVFPNPSTSHIYFRQTGYYYTDLNISVFDINGRVITNDMINERLFKLDIRSFKNGIYLILITDSNKNEILRTKIFKN